MKVTDYIAEILVEHGVTTVFGYQGSSVAHLIDSISQHPNLTFVETRHEQGAAFAANGYALSAGGLSVAVACSGPGGINLISGIADAYYDSLPGLFITGQVSQKEMKTDSDMRQNGFQETDIVSIVSPITKYAVSISEADKIKDELTKAIQAAVSGRPGPVLLDIPHNIQTARICPEKIVKSVKECVSAKPDIDAVIEELENSRRPVFVFGGGIRRIDIEQAALLDRLSIPVVTSYRGKDRIDNCNVCYCGTFGVFGLRCANWAVRYSDCIVCFGSRLDGRQTAGEDLHLYADKKISVIDVDLHELNKFSDDYHKYYIDANDALTAIISRAEGNIRYKKWLSTIKVWEKRYPIVNEYRIFDGVNPNKLLRDISRKSDIDANIAVDVGQNQLWANTSMIIAQSQYLVQSCGLGAMGFALPAAIGAYFARSTQTICITGDGGLQMNIQELQTIKEYKIPIKIVLLNNKSLGLIRDYQNKALNGRHYGSVSGFGSPDYEFLAKAYGLKYVKIKDNTYNDVLEEILKDDIPYIVEADISRQSTAYPEPTYGSDIINQSMELSGEELERIKEEAYGCR